MPSTDGGNLATPATAGKLSRWSKFKGWIVDLFARPREPALPPEVERKSEVGRRKLEVGRGNGTGDPILDFVLEAGPRAFIPELAIREVRFAIAKTGALGAYKDALQHLAQHQVAIIHAAIREVGRQNRIIEKESKATRAFLPYYRKPVLLHDFFEAIYGEGCWQDNDFVEDVLKHHPELRINVRRGIRGQEYRVKAAVGGSRGLSGRN